MDATDEVERVRRAKEGDTEAFEALIDAHQRSLFNIAYRMVGDHDEAEDLTQSAFVKAYQHIGRFDGRSPFFGWIYRILVNEALNLLARRKRQAPLEEPGPDPGPGPEAECSDHETERIIHEALGLLTEDHRQVIILRHFVQLSYREIGDTLGVPEKTVKSRLFTARQQLREILVRRGVSAA
jgi:RNA polymerase sigma-70 factor (ECF subfamily)